MTIELRWLNGKLQMRQQVTVSNSYGSAGAYGGGGTYPVWSDWQDVPEEYVYVSYNSDSARGAGSMGKPVRKCVCSLKNLQSSCQICDKPFTPTYKNGRALNTCWNQVADGGMCQHDRECHQTLKGQEQAK